MDRDSNIVTSKIATRLGIPGAPGKDRLLGTTHGRSRWAVARLLPLMACLVVAGPFMVSGKVARGVRLVRKPARILSR